MICIHCSDEVASPSFSTTVGYPKLRLSFDRWLGVSSGDTVTIKVCCCLHRADVQACIPNGACTTLWSGTATFDVAWKRVIFGLPVAFGNRPAVEVGNRRVDTYLLPLC